VTAVTGVTFGLKSLVRISVEREKHPSVAKATARLKSLLKNAFEGREAEQGLKPKQMCSLAGTTKVMPCYKALCAAFFSKL
jgi:hypothetical protein